MRGTRQFRSERSEVRSGDPAGRSIWLIEEYGPSAYGDRFADIYDERPEVLALDTEGAVVFLAEHAGSGRVLELAMGTGRLRNRGRRSAAVVPGRDIRDAGGVRDRSRGRCP
jgi:hypothetical protein